MHRCNWILVLLISSLFVGGCHKPNPTFLIYSQKGDIKIEVDSVIRRPELANFPIRLRITNYTNKKVALVFDTISKVYKHQVKNLYIIQERDTSNLGVNISRMPLILNEKTVTSLNCLGYFHKGKGSFESFKEIESRFKEGKLVYRLGKKQVNLSQLEELHIEADTLLLPTLLEVKTDKTLLDKNFLQQFFRPIREAKL